jgi:anti-sigma regulatory factor (Ser/Thr protein kinase)
VNDWRQTTHTESLDAAALSARSAREVLREICADARVSPPVTETALLLVSEVVTNSVLHGSGRPLLDISVRPQVLRVSVTDDAAALPRLQRNNPLLGDGGRGLQLVEALASRWGTDRRIPTGKSVWFEIDHD